ncbi:hypothetical protein M427DRAFT_289202 [Gonapodya prolifera JEL478]|uniref:SH3 domain-containing protein n=1 Tax=Gonapodya prolifera (strain JEL478) TaxID=1344416 RepID=A0A139AIQ3_GONPJ|nr:hypothetical protein M427DRAFT_289202 [Gonapodya prolifera JEL478]|eukprot:KXS16692.1 hypothetical protein M427DRAFT_289202 [Gonapodya prolifera JEL478]
MAGSLDATDVAFDGPGAIAIRTYRPASDDELSIQTGQFVQIIKVSVMVSAWPVASPIPIHTILRTSIPQKHGIFPLDVLRLTDLVTSEVSSMGLQPPLSSLRTASRHAYTPGGQSAKT